MTDQPDWVGQVAPLASVHTPLASPKNTQPLTQQQAAAYWTAFTDELLAQVLLAVAGVIGPAAASFLGLTQWATALQQAAQNALTTANGAQTTANGAQTTATDADTKAGDALALISTVQADETAKAAATQTMWQAIDAAISTYALTNWSAMADAINTAYTTWKTAVTGIDASEDTTILNFLSKVFGINLDTGLLSPTQVQGVSGEQTLIDTFNNMYDQLAAALNPTLSLLGLATLPLVATSAQTVATQASNAHDMAVTSAQILAIRNNATTYDGLDNTSQSNMPITALTTASIKNPGFSNVGLVRVSKSAKIGAVTFIANVLGTPSPAKPLYVNIFRLNFTTNIFEFIYASADLASTLTSTSRGQVRCLLPGPSNFDVEPGDVIAVELSGQWSATASGNVYLNYGSNPGIGNHPTALMSNIAGSFSGRTAAPVQASGNMAISTFTFSSAAPYISLEISTLPADYQPPLPTTYDGAGTVTHTLQSWLEAGDLVDLTGLAAGGGGEGELGGATGYGGTGGSWGGRTLVVGTDVPVPAPGSPVTISIVRGAGGALGPYFTAGGDGGDTTFTWHDPGGTAHTLTCAHGYGGNHTIGLSHNTLGTGLAPSPQNYKFPTSGAFAINHYGGAAQYNNYPGNAPGGAGAGGSFGQYGTAGADGSAWVVERQAV